MYTLPETNIAPENWWLGDYFSFWEGILSGAMLVYRSVILPKLVANNNWLVVSTHLNTVMLVSEYQSTSGNLMQAGLNKLKIVETYSHIGYKYIPATL